MITVVGKDLSVVKRITCRNCGSILEYYTKDVTEGTSKSGCSWIKYKFIICPVCAQEVTTQFG